MFRSNRASQLFRLFSGSKMPPVRSNAIKSVIAPIVGVGAASAAVIACLLDKEKPFEIEGDIEQQSQATVISTHQIIRVDSKATVGRSRGHIVWTEGVAKTSNVFYNKKVYSREKLLNELVLCGLLHDLYKETDTPFPAVFVLERTTHAGKKLYSFMSEDVGGTARNINLLHYLKARGTTELDLSKLKNIGVIVAFNRLVGNTDCNLKNFILHQQTGVDYLYGIDFEYAFIQKPSLLTSAEQVSETIVELINPVFQFTTAMQFNDTIASFSKRQLIAAIKNELDDGSVIMFYQKFADMTRNQIEDSLSRLDGLMTPVEKTSYLAKILNSQQLVHNHLISLKAEHEPARLLTKQ